MASLLRKPNGRRFGISLVAALLVATVSGAAYVALQEDSVEGWPREIPVDGGLVVVYQPQSDTFEGNMLSGRVAVSVTPTDQEPVFGTVWFEARLVTDRDTRMAVIDDFDVTRVGFPGANE